MVETITMKIHTIILQILKSNRTSSYSNCNNNRNINKTTTAIVASTTATTRTATAKTKTTTAADSVIEQCQTLDSNSENSIQTIDQQKHRPFLQRIYGRARKNWVQ